MKSIMDKYDGNREYIDSIKDMTLKEIAIKYCKEMHLPKFLFVRPLVDLSYHLLIGKDREINKLKRSLEEQEERYTKVLSYSFERLKGNSNCDICELQGDCGTKEVCGMKDKKLTIEDFERMVLLNDQEIKEK